MTSVLNEFEFNLFLTLTILLLIVKGLLCVYLGKKLLDKKKETGKWTMTFVTAFFFLLVSLLVSRLIYMDFDFILTQFDPDTYYLMPNLLAWKFGVLFSTVGFVILLVILDYKVLKFKLKGIPAFFVLGVVALILFIPVNNSDDFVFVSGLGIIGGAAGFMVLVIFLYIGIKIPGLRRPAFLILAGLITYVAGSVLYSEYVVAILISIYGLGIRVIAYSLFMFLKIIGLFIMSYSVTKFSL